MKTSLIPLLLASAFWPVWLWFFARTMDRSDEPWGLLSLATAVAFIAIHRKSSRQTLATPAGEPPMLDFVLGLGCIVAYVATFSFAPNLIHAILFILTMYFLFVSKLPTPSKTGIAGLLLLSLPLLPSLNFYAGYPLRVLVAQGACGMLELLNRHASVDGVVVAVNGHVSAIDAPCSGINMLWSELYLCMVLACWFNLNFKQSFVLAVAGFGLTLVANILRASTLLIFDQLSFFQSRELLLKQEPTVHMLAGLVIFFAVCAASVVLASILKSYFKEERAEAETAKEPNSSSLMRYYKIPVLALGCAAALIPLIVFPGGSTTASTTPPKWPQDINGHKLIPFDSLAEEKEFAADFPGAMQKFTDGTNSYFVRYVRKETRQLHSSADCLRGMGYEVEPKPISVEQDGTKWGTFEATKNGARYLIKERIYDSQGVSTTDVSQWYWLATLQKIHGPWFAITIAEPN